MAWIESHQEVWRHPKTKKLARLLNTSLPATIGHLHGLWYWAIDFAPGGDLSQYDAEEIADAVMWEGNANVLLSALQAAGYLDTDEDGGLYIHDWAEYGGKLPMKKLQGAERQKRYREKEKAARLADDANVTHDEEQDNALVTRYSRAGNASREEDIREKNKDITPPIVPPKGETDAVGKKPEKSLKPKKAKPPPVDYPALVSELTPSERVREAALGWIDMRLAKGKRFAPTERAVRLAFKQIREWGYGEKQAVECFNRSTVGNWQGVFRLDDS